MDPTELEAEQKIMKDFVAAGTDFIHLMDQARNKLDDLLKMRKKIEKFLQRLVTIVEAAAAHAASTKAPPPPAGSTPAAATTSRTPVRLPQIEMQHYNGDLLSWYSWWEFFDSSVHSDPIIGDMQKFTYLVSALEGPAKKAIEGIHMTEVNYKTAIDILRNRFGKTGPIRQALYNELRNVPKPANNASSLRHFEQEVEKLCRQLEKMDEDLDNEEMLYRLQEKLPYSLAKELVKEKKAAKQWNTTKFREKLSDIVERQEEIERTTTTHEPTQSAPPPAHQGQMQNSWQEEASTMYPTAATSEQQTLWHEETSTMYTTSAPGGERNAALFLTSKATVFNVDEPNRSSKRIVYPRLCPRC